MINDQFSIINIFFSFKKIHGKQNIYSVRIGLSYRAMGLKKDNTVR
ncbi:MAG: hypothetical protein IPM38_12775 [Ignavibacteria bacterium]|nr:hypothetical protein [Ignavibacteria bacterium]